MQAPEESAGSTSQAQSRPPRLAGSLASLGEHRNVFSQPWSTSGIEFEYPTRLAFPPNWLGHIPFAFWLVGVQRPRTVVELGVHTGNSYCAFLQATQLLRFEARCFGIDHWQGEEHVSFSGEEVYNELRSFHDPLYGSFSTLLRLSFDDALPCFGDGTIDLLHIDGFHSYEAISHDFTNWLPKLSSRGIVLFHDTNARQCGFGIWQFFAEIAARYPTFEFLHSHGLGIAYVGNETLPAPLRALFKTDKESEAVSIRNYFARLGASVLDGYSLRRAQAIEQEREALKAEVGRLQHLLFAIESDRDAARSMLDQQMSLVGRLQREVMETKREPKKKPVSARIMRRLRVLAARLRSLRS